jgi:3-carboxy-cis,cis-muconate cycloisomerase
MNPLTSANRLFAPLFIDEDVAARFSTDRSMGDFHAFEAALVDAQSATGQISAGDATAIKDGLKSFEPDLDAIATSLIVDGLPVPEYIRQLKAHIGAPHSDAVHLCVTSQDLIDTSFAMACRDVNAALAGRLSGLIASLDDLVDRFGANPLTGRTRMQAALPITVAQRVEPWRTSMVQAAAELERLRPKIEIVQLGGPVGLYRHSKGGETHATAMAQALGLYAGAGQWHTNRSSVADYANWLSQVTGGLGKMGMDMALMSQQGIGTLNLAKGGRSSAMPHKKNPVLAEVLVAFARHNATQLGLVHQALVHEQERSGTAWTIEWMTLPGMMSTTSRAITLAQKLLSTVVDIAGPPQND